MSITATEEAQEKTLQKKACLKIEIETKELLQALNFASSLVEKRNVIEALSKIKLTATNGALEIGATDIDLYLNQKLGAHVISQGEAMVETSLLVDIVRKITDEKIIIEHQYEANSLLIISKNCRFELYTPQDESFPQMEELNANIVLTLESKDLLQILEMTSFAMSNDETRYNLNGVYLHKHQDYVYGCALDGHRLSVSGINLPTIEDNDNQDIGVILPKKTVMELIKILRSNSFNNANIVLNISSSRIKFSINDLVLISKIIDGDFPEYQSFIPQHNEFILNINRQVLAEAISRVATVTLDKFRAIKIALYNEQVTISARGDSKGVANENIKTSDNEDNLCNYQGEEIIIGFNPKYIIDVLDKIKSKNVKLFFADSNSPILIEAEPTNNNRFIVMPVKV